MKIKVIGIIFIFITSMIFTNSVFSKSIGNTKSIEKVNKSHLAVQRIKYNLEKINNERAGQNLPPITIENLDILDRYIDYEDYKEFISDDDYENGYVEDSNYIRYNRLADVFPKAVDNSELSSFPEIRNQGQEGSCVYFSILYYQYTHEVGMLYGWDNKNSDNSTKFSPRWGYSSGLSGEYSTVHDILLHHGAVTWDQFPYSDDNDKSYCMNPEYWKDALKYRASNAYSLTSSLDIKKALLNGHVLQVSTHIHSWNYTSIDNDVNTNEDDEFIGQQICIYKEGSNGNHAVTIVGYNDDIWVDLNNNGQVETEEKGAFKIANSWGADWKNEGYCWVSYDALNRITEVPGGYESDTRYPIFGISSLVLPRKNYSPKLLAKYTIYTSSRSETGIQVLVSDPEVDTDNKYFYPKMFKFPGGKNLSFNGTDTPEDAAFYLDLTDFIKVNKLGDYKLGLRTHGTIAEIRDYSLIDVENDYIKVSQDTPLIVEKYKLKYLSNEYEFEENEKSPKLVLSSSEIDFGEINVGENKIILTKLENSGDGNLIINSIEIDNSSFSHNLDLPLTIQAGQSENMNILFNPDIDDEITGKLSIFSNDPNEPVKYINLSGKGIKKSQEGSSPDNPIIIEEKNISTPINLINGYVWIKFKEIPYGWGIENTGNSFNVSIEDLNGSAFEESEQSWWYQPSANGSSQLVKITKIDGSSEVKVKFW